MALSDLSVFSEYAYAAMTEVLAQQVALFNEASNGTITLRSAAHQGDYSDVAFFKKVSGLVRRRNAYGSGAVSEKVLQHIVDTMVKVAAGTPPVRLDPSQFKWIQLNPEVAGAALGQQLAKDAIADMLNTGIMAGQAALSGVVAIIYDGTGDSPDTLNPIMLNNGVAKFGDAHDAIRAWIMHSGSLFQLYGNALTNTQMLFTYGTVNVRADAFGRRFVVSDVPVLFTAGSPNIYWAMGLATDALRVDQNNDFTDNYQMINGDENIKRTYQAEWSYNLGVKGFAWDKTNGSHSPNDAALATASNWDKFATSNKDIAGIMVKHN